MVAVYKILNKVNGKFYIGSSINLGKRWKAHIDELNRNVHDNTYLQNSWNKYHKDNFEFYILEIRYQGDNYKKYKDIIKQREQYYIDTLKPYKRDIGYNICKKTVGSGRILSVDMIKQGKSKQIPSFRQLQEVINLLCNSYYSLNNIALKVGLQSCVVKNIYSKNILSEYLEKYTFKKRPIKLDDIINDNDIYDIIFDMSNKGETVKNIYNFLKTKIPEYNLDYVYLKKVLKKYNIQCNYEINIYDSGAIEKPVYQYSLNGEFMQEFPSISSANMACNIANGKITEVCKGKRKHAGGYRWSYNKEELTISLLELALNKTLSNKKFPVIQYDLDWNPVAIYESARSITIGSPSIIRSICNNHDKKEFKGYHWKYAKDASDDDLKYFITQNQLKG